MQTKLLLSLFIISITSFAQECREYNVNDWQDSRYIVNGNGTITDKVTKLMWKRCPEGQGGVDCKNRVATGLLAQSADIDFNQPEIKDVGVANFKGAFTLNNSSFAGYSDWRLPNFKELESLLYYNCVNPAINKNIFPATNEIIDNVKFSNPHFRHFWTSTKVGSSPSRFLAVSFLDTGVKNAFVTDQLRVRLVRYAE